MLIRFQYCIIIWDSCDIFALCFSLLSKLSKHSRKVQLPRIPWMWCIQVRSNPHLQLSSPSPNCALRLLAPRRDRHQTLVTSGNPNLLAQHELKTLGFNMIQHEDREKACLRMPVIGESRCSPESMKWEACIFSRFFKFQHAASSLNDSWLTQDILAPNKQHMLPSTCQ